MRYHTAPAAALKALEAAARLLSFTKAAAELNVTQSAISHQIKHLEELWDVQLFHRRSRRLELTTAGRALAPVVREFFSRLDETLDTIRREGSDTAIRIEALPSFAVKWLVPRLQKFRDAHPEADVWLSTDFHASVSFEGSNADIAIHMSRGDYPGYDSQYMMPETVLPVCRPRFLETHGQPRDPEDLCRFPLLLRYEEILTPTWEYWFRSVGVPEEVYSKALTEGTHFPNSQLALQAAFEGQGVALGRGAHVWDDVRSGRLVRLFPEIDCAFELSYYVVSPRGRMARPLVAAFRDWAIAEGALFCQEYEACGE